MRTATLKSIISCFVSFMIIQTALNAQYMINVSFSGSQEVPPNNSAATGTFTGSYNESTDSLIYTVTFSDLSDNATAAHFHAAPPGLSSGVVIPATGFPTGVTSGSFTDTLVLTSGQEDTLKRGLFYFNIHTSAIPSGEIRAQIFLQDSTLVATDITCANDTSFGNDPGLCSASASIDTGAVTGTPAPEVYFRIGGTQIDFPYVFPVGTTTVTVVAWNAAGYDTCTVDVTVNDVEPPVVNCPSDITQDNDPGECGAVVDFDVSATDNCPGVTVATSHDSGSFFPVGTTTVTVTATDAAGNTSTCSFDITVNDVEPPVIHDLATSRKFLWPPNHRMRNVMVDYTSTDNCPGPISCEITVTSNEPDNGTGDGNTSPDWEILNDHIIKLRSERSGTGDGRIYTIVVSCTDQYNNTGSDSVTVLVPHNMTAALVRSVLDQYGNMGNGNGQGGTANMGVVVLNEFDPENSTLIQVFPNPSRNYFNVNIEAANDRDALSLRIFDVSGRTMEIRNNITGSQTIRIGDRLRSGMYIAEFRQGEDVKTFKLLKLE